jgi:F-type H+-transporting ATPase subunit a
MKKRYIIYIALVLSIIFGFGLFGLPTQPVLPNIQLPGEVLARGVPFVGVLTNTFIGTLLAYLVVIAIALAARARSRSAEEVPSGFYNVIEALIEGAYGYVENAAGKWARAFFPFFMTFILLILAANWIELIPGVDSIGIPENIPHHEAELAAEEAREAFAAGMTPLEVVEAAPIPGEVGAQILGDLGVATDEPLSQEQQEEVVHNIEETVDEDVNAENVGDLLRGVFLVRAPTDAEGNKPDDADWTIVPFVRAAATDLNFTIALALVSVLFTQYFGFRALGPRYLSKFFTYNGDKIKKNPLSLMDTLVGIIEFISEIAKILSFSFRLLGNIFAGQVLLFVIAFLLPVALVAVYGLEFFVGAIQALVFGLLTLTFMAGATTSHHDDEHEH